MSFPMQKYNKKTAKANVSASFTSFYSIWQEQEVRDIHFFFVYLHTKPNNFKLSR